MSSAPMPPPTPAAGSPATDDSAVLRSRSSSATTGLIARDLAAGVPQLVAQTEGMRVELSAMRGDIQDLEREMEALRRGSAEQTQISQQVLVELQTLTRIESARDARERAQQERHQQIEDAERETRATWEQEDRERRLRYEDEERALELETRRARADAEVQAIRDRARLRTKVLAAATLVLTAVLGALATWVAAR